jgi:hypothetical protein
MLLVCRGVQFPYGEEDSKPFLKIGNIAAPSFIDREAVTSVSQKNLFTDFMSYNIEYYNANM